MPQHHNAASRLHAFLSAPTTHTDQTQVLSAWASTLGVSGAKQSQTALMVNIHLQAAQREIEVVRVGMSAANYSTHLYEAALSAFEDATSPLLLPSTWNAVRQYLTPQNLLALQFCSEILPDEEDPISVEELRDIAQLVADLRAAIAESKLPGALLGLIAHHAELIERALALYPIAGAKALREAARTGLGELIESRETVSAHRDTEEVSRLGKTWKKVNAAADAALKLDKLVQVGQKAWNLIEGVIQSAA